MKFSCLIITLLLSSLGAQADVNRASVRKGIDLLFAQTENATRIDREKLTDKALTFKKRYDETIANYKLTGLKTTKINLTTTQFQFSSAVQIPGEKSNTVYGYIYHPLVPAGCLTKFPATLFIHHVANNLSSEQMFASLAAQMKKGVVMLIFLPDYGPRKQNPDSPPFASDLRLFKEKLFQTLVDVRVSAEFLARQDDVDSSQLQLGGLSLGGLVTAMSAGIDPFFQNYLIAMGGGDIAGILGMDKSKKTTSEVRNALANINWNVQESRQELSVLDALTWAYNISGKKIIFVNSKDDELINNEMSVQKLVRAYRENGNQVIYKEHTGSHVPQTQDLGIRKTAQIYYRVLSTIVDFLGKSQSAALEQCQIR